MSKSITVKFTRNDQFLKVLGTLWCGKSSGYEYKIGNKIPESLEDARRLAVDFESLSQAKIINIVEKVVQTTTTTNLK